jgi:hypothetical protein
MMLTMAVSGWGGRCSSTERPKAPLQTSSEGGHHG